MRAKRLGPNSPQWWFNLGFMLLLLGAVILCPALGSPSSNRADDSGASDHASSSDSNGWDWGSSDSGSWDSSDSDSSGWDWDSSDSGSWDSSDSDSGSWDWGSSDSGSWDSGDSDSGSW